MLSSRAGLRTCQSCAQPSIRIVNRLDSTRLDATQRGEVVGGRAIRPLTGDLWPGLAWPFLIRSGGARCEVRGARCEVGLNVSVSVNVSVNGVLGTVGSVFDGIGIS